MLVVLFTYTNAHHKYSQPISQTHTHTLSLTFEGVCDDPRGTKFCKLGTDCNDCGIAPSDADGSNGGGDSSIGGGAGGGGGAYPNPRVFVTKATQLIYHNAARITLSGSGFNPGGTSLRFANLLVEGDDYETVTTSVRIYVYCVCVCACDYK